MIKQLFTWWNSQTLGTFFFTLTKGRLVGKDENGNIFYETSDKKKRWVIYNKEIEASSISSEWHGWLHYTFDEAPSDKPLKRKKWEKSHLPNMTGSVKSYHPLNKIKVQKSYEDYESWSPDE